MFHREFVTGLTTSGVLKLEKLQAFFLTEEKLQTDFALSEYQQTHITSGIA